METQKIASKETQIRRNKKRNENALIKPPEIIWKEITS
jgi:hypothetical protein